jgi:hypothetical protein
MATIPFLSPGHSPRFLVERTDNRLGDIMWLKVEGAGAVDHAPALYVSTRIIFLQYHQST